MPTPGTSTMAGRRRASAGTPAWRAAGSRRGSRPDTPRGASPAARPASSSGAPPAHPATSGRTLVGRKWSGQEVPSAASGASFSLDRKSSTGSVSVKWPTWRRSVDTRPRITGANRPPWRGAARSEPRIRGATGPNGCAPPRESGTLGGPDDLSEFASHCVLGGTPGVVIPCPPRSPPSPSGAPLEPPRCPAELEPRAARRHPHHPSPKISLVSASPFGWRWRMRWAASGAGGTWSASHQPSWRCR